MNKLIIIGNGFDIAHGNPTGYQSFFNWLVKKSLLSVYAEQYGSESAINPMFKCTYDKSYRISPNEVNQHISNIYQDLIKNFQNDNAVSFGWGDEIDFVASFSLKSNSDFATHLFEGACENWVDIEHSYYLHLKKILATVTNGNIKSADSALKELNMQLTFLRDNLKIYLTEIKAGHCIDDFHSVFNKKIDSSNLFLPDVFDLEVELEEPITHVLNFNYTNTINQYFDGVEGVQINNIHGSIADDDNPLIFGYGDELDEDFQLMERQDIPGFLENIKSLWYLRTKHYHNLIRFLDADYFQVQIFGHSCGRSDRTLLNMVFEHDYCNSIDIHYRRKDDGSDNFNSISEEISRQFTDKKKLRKRVLPKNPNNIIPQYVW